MQSRRLVIPFFLIAAIAALLLLRQQTADEETPNTVIPVRTAVLTGDLPQKRLQIAGTTQSAETALLRFQVSGRVTEKPVKLGDQINKGDILAKVYNPELEPVAQRAKDNLKRTKAQAEQANNDFQRVDALYKEQAVTQQEWENAQTRLTAASTAVDAANAELTRANQVSGELSLVAPFSGSVTDILIDVGEVVSSGAPAMRLSNPEAVELKLPLSDKLISEIKVGQTVLVKPALDPNAQAIQGQISEISPFREQGSLPEAVVSLDAQAIAPGTAVNAFVMTTAASGISLPLRSVLMTGENTVAVYRVRDNVASLVAIRPLAIDSKFVTIEGELAAGDEIITEGLAQLYDGAHVEVLK